MVDVVSLKPLLWLICIVPLLAVAGYGLVDRPRLYKFGALGLRILAILLLILALCRPFITFKSDDIHLAFLLDVSESVDLAGSRDAIGVINECIGELKPSDSWSLFIFGDGIKHFDTTKEAAAELDRWLQSTPDSSFRSASRLAEAMLSARLCFEANKARRMVLLTDGRPTHRGIEEALESLAKERIDLRIHRLPGLRYAEACIESLRPSTTRAYEGEVVRMTARIKANRKMSARLNILNKAAVVSQKELVLEPDADNVVSVEVPMNTSGATHWTAELLAENDHFLVNNKAACTITVDGKPRILVLHETPRKMRSFEQSMIEQGFEVDLRGKQGLPEDMASLLAFDAVILANIAATDMSPNQMEMLKRYVIDFGGGLAMLGSNNSFGLGGYYTTPVEDVLPLTSRYEKQEQQPSVAIALVIDKSGSMYGMPIELARRAAKAAVDLLGRQDYAGVIAFDGRAFVASPMLRLTEKDSVKNAIDAIADGGGTSMYPGIEAAFRMLHPVSAAIKHVIILSDGQSQPGNHQGLVAKMVNSGITVSTVALGDADRALMASLAQIGKGRYYEATDPASVPQIFTKETIETSGTAVKEGLFHLVRTSDHPLLSGFKEHDIPAVFGYVMTSVKPATQLLLAADSGDPIMATSRYGLGSSIAYTSDAGERWASQWLTWDQFGRFWSQALRGILRRDSTEGLQLRQAADENRWTVHITRRDESGKPVTGIDFDAQTMDDTETVRKVKVEEIGLGSYRAAVPVDEADSLTLRLYDRDHDKLARIHFNKPYPSEYSLAGKAAAQLDRIPELESRAIRQGITPERIRKSISHICYLLALAAMLGGLLLRRV